LRFEGRVLDKDPIKIKLYKNKNSITLNAEGTNNATSSAITIKGKEALINLK
jgi:hypothetical protein